MRRDWQTMAPPTWDSGYRSSLGWPDRRRVAVTEVRPIPLAPERHREIVPWITLDGGLHPYHAASANISFQRRNSCRVRSDELIEERVVPVKNNYSIITEVNVARFAGVNSV